MRKNRGTVESLSSNVVLNGDVNVNGAFKQPVLTWRMSFLC